MERKRFSKKKKRGGNRDKDGMKEKGVYSEEKEGCWWSAYDGLTKKRKEKDSQKKKKKKRRRRKSGEDRDKDGVKKKGVYSKEKEGLCGGRWEIIKKVRENIILIKKCVW